MKKYKKRVIAEYDELQIKLYALEDFIRDHEKFSGLWMEDRVLLEGQHLHMTQYATVLRQRIARF